MTSFITVQAVVKSTSQSNGNGQISTPRGSETPERISMKLGTYNYVVGMGNGRFPYKTFPGQSLSLSDVSRTDVSRTICTNNFEYFGMFMNQDTAV